MAMSCAPESIGWTPAAVRAAPGLSATASPLLVVISGPSGVGKDTILKRLKRRRGTEDRAFVITATTRTPRPKERNGVDYTFLTEEQFQGLLAHDGLLEHAQVYRYRYGVPREPVRQALASGKDVIVRVDVQGAAHIRELAPEAVLIFVAPSSLMELEQRLRARGTEGEAALQLRLQVAREEMARLPEFDYVVVNAQGQVERTMLAIEAILTAEHHRTKPRQVRL